MTTSRFALRRFIPISLLLVILHGSSILSLDPGDSCKTPSEDDGECIPITSCELYIRMIKEKPLTEEKKKFLQRAQCGVKGKTPLLCCPFLVHENGSDVRGHPNWRLLAVDSCGEEYSDTVFDAEDGKEARITKFENTALIKYQTNEGPRFLCGGSVISARYMLTAAHCVATDDRNKLLSVRLGEHDLKSDPDCKKYSDDEECNDPIQEIDVEEVIPHPMYQSSGGKMKHDIALIRLATPAKLTDNVMPICLPSGHALDRLVAESNMFVAGWEIASNGSTSDLKLWAPVAYLSDEECSTLYERDFTLDEDQMCVRGVGNGACFGDSGGPLMLMVKGRDDRRGIYATCVGILSMRSTDCTDKSVPSIYTRVEPHMEWILDNLKP